MHYPCITLIFILFVWYCFIFIDLIIYFSEKNIRDPTVQSNAFLLLLCPISVSPSKENSILNLIFITPFVCFITFFVFYCYTCLKFFIGKTTSQDCCEIMSEYVYKEFCTVPPPTNAQWMVAVIVLLMLLFCWERTRKACFS